jgi:hypothetical protein
MNKLLFVALIALSGCATVNTIAISNSSPGFVTVVGPIFEGCNQRFTDVAQAHCSKYKRAAVFTSSQRIPIQGNDICSYECKR